MSIQPSDLPSSNAFVPTTAHEVWDVLCRLDREQNETKITFAVAAGLFLAGLKKGFYNKAASGIDRYVLFFKFVESIDPKMRFSKTFTSICGRFVNYCDGNLINDSGELNTSSMEAVRAIVDGLRSVGFASEEQQSRVMRALLRVRDASHLFVSFSYDWSMRFSDIDQILEAKFRALHQSDTAPNAQP